MHFSLIWVIGSFLTHLVIPDLLQVLNMPWYYHCNCLEDLENIPVLSQSYRSRDYASNLFSWMLHVLLMTSAVWDQWCNIFFLLKYVYGGLIISWMFLFHIYSIVILRYNLLPPSPASIPWRWHTTFQISLPFDSPSDVCRQLSCPSWAFYSFQT